MSDEHNPASFDAQFDALCHPRRRRLLTALLDAKADDDLPVMIDQLEEADDESFEMAMYHVHIPRLEEKGLVEVGDDDRAVTPGPRFREMRPLLELISSNRERLPGDWV